MANRDTVARQCQTVWSRFLHIQTKCEQTLQFLVFTATMDWKETWGWTFDLLQRRRTCCRTRSSAVQIAGRIFVHRRRTDAAHTFEDVGKILQWCAPSIEISFCDRNPGQDLHSERSGLDPETPKHNNFSSNTHFTSRCVVWRVWELEQETRCPHGGRSRTLGFQYWWQTQSIDACRWFLARWQLGFAYRYRYEDQRIVCQILFGYHFEQQQ